MCCSVRPHVGLLLCLAATPLQLGAQGTLADSAKVLHARAEAAQKEANRAALERAVSLWTQSAELYRRAGDRRGQGNATHGVGSAYQMLGRSDSAMVFYDQALRLRTNAGDRKSTRLNSSHVLRSRMPSSA